MSLQIVQPLLGMNKRIGESLDFDDEVVFLQQVWGISPSHVQRSGESVVSYFGHYETICKTCHRFLEQYTHQDMITIAKEMAIDPKKKCMTALTQRTGITDYSRSFEVEEGLKLVGKAVYCLDITEWQELEVLSDFIRRCLATPSVEKQQYRLPKTFNARNFAEVAGINIQWTMVLNKHLEVGAGDNDMAVFHGCSILHLYSISASVCFMPAEFIAETKNTLDLLFPTTGKKVRRWLRQEQKKFNLDSALQNRLPLKAKSRRTLEFEFWRDRLIVAKEVYDDCEPRGWRQVLTDNRRPVQYWTFWIAICAFLLSLIACIEGAMQVYKAYHPT